MESLDNLPGAPFDAITAFGSMHHMPHEIQQKQLSKIVRQLKVGGIWLQLAYPINRWLQLRIGSDTFPSFGKSTDGEQTPWAEWYEPGKLIKVLEYGGDIKMKLNWCGIYNENEFSWFELTRET